MTKVLHKINNSCRDIWFHLQIAVEIPFSLKITFTKGVKIFIKRQGFFLVILVLVVTNKTKKNWQKFLSIYSSINLPQNTELFSYPFMLA